MVLGGVGQGLEAALDHLIQPDAAQEPRQKIQPERIRAIGERMGRIVVNLLAPGSEGFGGAFVRWDSDDASTAANRPLLTITAEVPEPSAIGLAMLSASLVSARRRRRHA